MPTQLVHDAEVVLGLAPLGKEPNEGDGDDGPLPGHLSFARCDVGREALRHFRAVIRFSQEALPATSAVPERHVRDEHATTFELVGGGKDGRSRLEPARGHPETTFDETSVPLLASNSRLLTPGREEVPLRSPGAVPPFRWRGCSGHSDDRQDRRDDERGHRELEPARLVHPCDVA
jgi:hypothetical protein